MEHKKHLICNSQRFSAKSNKAILYSINEKFRIFNTVKT